MNTKYEVTIVLKSKSGHETELKDTFHSLDEAEKYTTRQIAYFKNEFPELQPVFVLESFDDDCIGG